MLLNLASCMPTGTHCLTTEMLMIFMTLPVTKPTIEDCHCWAYNAVEQALAL